MITRTVLDKIAYKPDIEGLLTYLHIDKDGRDADTLIRLAGEAADIARPKAVYKIAFIEDRGEDFVVADGIRFSSRVMSVNLSKVNRVFPIIATCGREIEEWSKGVSDMLQQYWADKIKEMALRSAVEKGIEDINDRYDPGKTSYMSPGSLEDWPLSEQKGLFSLMGNPESDIGVELTDSFLMLPTKTVSRIMFAAEKAYENCQLCPRDGCPNRRAPYEADLYKKTYEVL